MGFYCPQGCKDPSTCEHGPKRNAAQLLAFRIEFETPSLRGATVEVDEADPATVAKFPNAPWFIHVRFNGKFLPIEWRPEWGFGFGADDDVGFEHPSTVLTDVTAAAEHVVKRLT